MGNEGQLHEGGRAVTEGGTYPGTGGFLFGVRRCNT